MQAGFREVQFFHRFLDAFMLGVHCRAALPVDLLLSLLRERVSQVPDAQLRATLSGEQLASYLRRAWSRAMMRNRLSGHTLANLTAVCVEAYLQSGEYFTKGRGSNDLVRRADGIRWEIKGCRNADLVLTINQSHTNLDATTFLLYWGRAEENQLSGVYYLPAREEYFTSRQPNRNMRRLRAECLSKLVQIYP